MSHGNSSARKQVLDMGYNEGILKYIQNLHTSKKLDILYYILHTRDSLGKESFLAGVTEFENGVDFFLLSIPKRNLCLLKLALLMNVGSFVRSTAALNFITRRQN